MKIFGTHDENTLNQLREVAKSAWHTAIMADGHLGYIMPVGGVAAYDNKVSVSGVGYDIACGNAAIKTDLTIDDLCGYTIEEIEANGSRINRHPALAAYADEIQRQISFGIGRKNSSDTAPVNDPLFVDPAWWIYPNIGAQRGYRDELCEKARQQLGTVGSGNHYVDVFADERGRIWVGVHFGSRGFGHTVASDFMALSAGARWGEKVPETEALLSLDSQLGVDYWAMMELAGRYAYVGREWVARRVVEILGGKELDLVHNHHNFAWKERHTVSCSIGENPSRMLANVEDRDLIVVRKGATPAFPGQRGFIGGSMGDNAVIVSGTTSEFGPLPDQLDSLFSTVHGAGRVMSRTEAAGQRHRNGAKRGQLKTNPDGTIKRPGKISNEDMRLWLNRTGVVLRGGGLDEAPQAYRRLPEVIAAQGGTVTVEHVLRPLIVVMAGDTEYDPFAD